MRGQQALQFMLVAAAYLALIAAFAGVERQALDDARTVAAYAKAKIEPAGGCMVAETFHLDGVNTALELGETNLTASGKSMHYAATVNASAECLVEVSGGRRLAVKERGKHYE